MGSDDLQQLLSVRAGGEASIVRFFSEVVVGS
jgi:hypothetical protein